MSDKHKARIEESIHQLIAELLVRRVKDPRVANVSIIRVDAAKDYTVARVMYNIIGGGDLAEVDRGLKSCAGFIRGQIKKHLRIRVIPELVFKYDSSLDKAMKLEELFVRIHDEEGRETGRDKESPRGGEDGEEPSDKDYPTGGGVDD